MWSVKNYKNDILNNVVNQTILDLIEFRVFLKIFACVFYMKLRVKYSFKGIGHVKIKC